MSAFQAWSVSTPIACSLSDLTDHNLRKRGYASWHNDNLSVLGSGLSQLFIPLPGMKSQKQFLQNSDASDNANMTNSFSDKC